MRLFPHSHSLTLSLPHSHSLTLSLPHSHSLTLSLPHSHSLTLSLPHSHSLTLSLPHSHSLTLSLPHSHSLTLSLPHSHSLTPSLSLPHSLTPSLTPSLPHSLNKAVSSLYFHSLTQALLLLAHFETGKLMKNANLSLIKSCNYLCYAAYWANTSLVPRSPTFFVLRFAFSIRKPKNKKWGRPGNEARQTPVSIQFYCSTQQLKGHIEALEGLGSQVCAADLSQFNSRVQGVKEDILSAIADYIIVQTKVESDDTGGWSHMTWVGGVT